MSRGIWWYMGARTRRRITFTWTALFVLSLLMQYLSFAAPPPTLANHDASDFLVFSKAVYGKFAETDCNGSNDAQASISGSDNHLFGRIHSHADYAAPGQNNIIEDDVTFGKHDGAGDPCQGTAGVNTYNSGPPENIDGDPAGVGACGWPGDLGTHLNTDCLQFDTIEQVLGPGATCDVGALSGPGSTSNITLTTANDGDVVCNGPGTVTDLPFQNTSMSITIVSHGKISINGQNAQLSPVSHGIIAWTDQDSNAVDVSILLNGSNFDITEKSIFFSPRSGQDISGSQGSELCIQHIGQGIIKIQGSDSEFGPGVCEGPDMTTTVNDQTITIGQSVTDLATVDGGPGTPEVTGTITFFVCGPSASNPACSSGGTQVGSPVTIVNEQATSAAFTPPAPGNYCFRAAYTPAVGSSYLPSSHTNLTTECFNVAKAQPTIGTTASASVPLGGDISDTATVSGGFNPTGTVTFTLFGPDNATCTGAPIFTSTTPLSGGSATSASFTPTAPGTYRWVAVYNGDANNETATSPCNAPNESVLVTVPNLNPLKEVRTLPSGSFAGSNTANPGNTIQFRITVANSGNATATNVPVTDDITALLAHGTFNQASCVPACAFNGTTDVISWTIASLAPGASTTFTYDIVLNSSFPEGTTVLPNVVVVTGPGSECPAGSTDPLCDTTTTVTGGPILNVTKLVRTGTTGAFGPTNTANPGQVVQFQITIINSGNAPATNVPVSDNISALLARATYNNDCSDSCTFASPVLSWTIPSIPAGATETITFSVTLSSSFPVGVTTLPNVVVVTGPGSNCPAGSTNPACDTTTTVSVASLTIVKSFTGNTGGTGPGGIPEARIGDTLTYTLAYDLTNGPVTNGVITDVVPTGLEYIVGSATGNAEFTFVSYTPATRTLRWTAPTVSADASVTYRVTVAAGANTLPQPLVNTATIDSDQTNPSSDTDQVLVEAPPLAITQPPVVTLPPTSTADPVGPAASNPGFTLMLVLLGLAGLVLAVGFVTPVPARVRRGERR